MKNNIFNFIDLHYGEENKEKVLDNIESNISFRGSNLWILACAIVIASIGLNINSTAVIIGAMLISPLMGPIVGAGFALAIYDFKLLKKSGKNLLIATIVSLAVATIYFSISPFKETQSEILSRTSPNFYDVLIAFFGGLAGVIALTRVEKGNPIPGVAIATALMPPICTAGYSLSIGNFSYFFGAIYLYMINCFFICISTYLIVKYLKYQPVSYLNSKFQKRIRYAITGLILLMIVPSIYLANNLLQEKKYSQKVENFIANEFVQKGYTVIFKKTEFNAKPKKIELAFLTKQFEEHELEALNKTLVNYDLNNTVLTIRQNTTDIKSEIINELGNQNKSITEKDVIIHNLQNEIRSYKFDDNEFYKETKILFPELKDVSIGKHLVNVNTDSVANYYVFLYKTDKKNNVDIDKLKLWLTEKWKTENIKIIKE